MLHPARRSVHYIRCALAARPAPNFVGPAQLRASAVPSLTGQRFGANWTHQGHGRAFWCWTLLVGTVLVGTPLPLYTAVQAAIDAAITNEDDVLKL
jgi:hypothetical protein